MRESEAGGAGGLTGMWTRMQVLASKDAEIEDLEKQLAASEKQRAELKETHNRLKAEHDECLDLIAALRRQIKETKDALELDTPKLLEIKNTVQTETSGRQEKLKARMKLGAGAPPKGGAQPVPAASGGKNGLEFGAMDLDGDGVLSKAEFKSKLSIMGWSFEEAEQTFKAMDRDGDGGISANEYAAFCQMEDKNLEFGTLNGIAKLHQQLADLQAQLAAAQTQLAAATASALSSPAGPPFGPPRICGVGMLLQANGRKSQFLRHCI
jgi:phage shock protein A